MSKRKRVAHSPQELHSRGIEQRVLPFGFAVRLPVPVEEQKIVAVHPFRDSADGDGESIHIRKECRRVLPRVLQRGVRAWGGSPCI